MKTKTSTSLVLFASIAFAQILPAQNSFPTSGNVGVGRLDPTFGDTTYGGAIPLLHVFNSGEAGSFRPIARFQAGTDDNYTGASIVINHSNDRGLIIEAGRGYSNQAIAHLGLVDNLGNVGRFMSAVQGGRVGFGTETPTRKFDIFHDGNADTLLRVENPNMGTSARSGLELRSDSSSGAYILLTSKNYNALSAWQDRMIFRTDSKITGGILINPAQGGFQVSTTGVGNPDLFVNPLGSVGIGTDTPDHKLDVVGTVRAHEIIVSTDGADFVFDDSYELTSLPELEKHIAQKGHLPGVPSAETMRTEGVGISELQTILLQKVEELTLHMIEKDKQIEKLQARIAKLESN